MLSQEVYGLIHRLIDEERLTPREIAEQAGCNPATVYRLMRGGNGHRKDKVEGRGRALHNVGVCKLHGRIELPCKACQAMQWLQEHPEQKLVEPPPSLYDESHRRETEELLRSCCDEFNEGHF